MMIGRQTFILVHAATLGVMTWNSNAMAQQKTARTCQTEWRANKAANQANGITEKVYVAQCRGGDGSTQPTAPAPTAATPRLGQAMATTGQKTVKECQKEWKANLVSNQAGGVTEKMFIAQCRARDAAVQPSPPTAGTGTTQTSSGPKTGKSCQAEWRANKANNQANGVTERAYVAECRGGGAPVHQSIAPPAGPTDAAAAPATPRSKPNSNGTSN
jgi:hypothetical protein